MTEDNGSRTANHKIHIQVMAEYTAQNYVLPPHVYVVIATLTKNAEKLIRIVNP